MMGSANKTPGAHPLAQDPHAAQAFLGSIRLPGARAELRFGPKGLPLGERGTGIVMGILDHDGSALDKAERILKRRGLRSGGSRTCALTPDTRAAHAFVEAASLPGRSLEVRFAAQTLALNARGAALVLAFLVAHPRRVRKAAAALGAEARYGWATGMVEAGYETSIAERFRPPKRTPSRDLCEPDQRKRSGF